MATWDTSYTTNSAADNAVSVLMASLAAATHRSSQGCAYLRGVHDTCLKFEVEPFPLWLLLHVSMPFAEKKAQYNAVKMQVLTWFHC